GSRPCASTLVAHVDEGLQAGAVGFAEHDLVARWADDRGFTRYFGGWCGGIHKHLPPCSPAYTRRQVLSGLSTKLTFLVTAGCRCRGIDKRRRARACCG